MAFNSLKCELESACLSCVREGIPFTIECDASEHTIAATLNQGGQPVAFHSRTLTPTELLEHLHPLSYVIPSQKKKLQQLSMQSKSGHYLHGQKFLLITDQRAVAYMFNPQRTGKIKNMKLQIWRTELGNFMKLSTNSGKIMWSLTLSQEFVVLHIVGLTSAKWSNNLVIQALRGWYTL